jgi:multiple sugar transport system substrate-binding protein
VVTKHKVQTYAAVLSISAVAVAGLTACEASGGGGGDETNTTVTIGMNSGLVPQFETYAADFMESHEGWTVKVSAVPDQQPEYIQQLVTQGLSNATPDIIFNYDTLNQTLAGNQLLFDIRPWMEEGKGGVELDAFLPNFLAQYEVGDAITGIPVSADSGLLYYRADLFEQYGVDVPQADWTLDDMYSAAQQITEASGGQTYGLFTPLGDATAYFTWYPTLVAYGSNVYDPDSEQFIFANDEGIEAWTELFKPYTEGWGTPYANKADSTAMFNSGQTAMMVTSNPGVSQFRDSLPDVDWNVQNLPRAEGNSTTGGGSYSLSISEKSPNKEGAWEFLSWFYSTDGGMKSAVPNGVIPATEDGLNNGAWKLDDNPLPSNLIPVIEYSVSNAVLPNTIPDAVQPKVVPALTKALEQVLLEGKSIKEAFTAAQDELNGLLG